VIFGKIDAGQQRSLLKEFLHSVDIDGEGGWYEVQRKKRKTREAAVSTIR